MSSKNVLANEHFYLFSSSSLFGKLFKTSYWALKLYGAQFDNSLKSKALKLKKQHCLIINNANHFD